MTARYRHLDLLTALFSAITVISGAIAGKIVEVSGITVTGAAVLFPFTYIFGDILTEVYGYQRTRRVIWIGLLCSAISVITYGAVAMLPPAAEFQDNAAYVTVLGQVPRIALAGWIAFFLGENANSITLSILKKKTNGKYLWVRTIGSTVVGQWIDTAVFLTLAFGGVLDNHLIARTMLHLYLWKLVVEVLFTPVTYIVVARLKESERLDTYDHGESYNPFRV